MSPSDRRVGIIGAGLGGWRGRSGAADAELSDHLDLVRLDPAYRASFWDGSAIHVRAGREGAGIPEVLVSGRLAAEHAEQFLARA